MSGEQSDGRDLITMMNDVVSKAQLPPGRCGWTVDRTVVRDMYRMVDLEPPCEIYDREATHCMMGPHRVELMGAVPGEGDSGLFPRSPVPMGDLHRAANELHNRSAL